jgi:putative ABC transport system permease protein
VFLLLAAFIVNVVVSRQVNAQRPEIAALKALGYESRGIAGHYLAFAACIVALGLAAGIALGAWLGVAMTRLYTDFFHFPRFHFGIAPWILGAAAVAAVGSACGGAWLATRGILRLQAAEAMRPPAPARFRPLLLERLGWSRVLSAPQRMILRNLERRPVRAATTVAGIAGSAAILIAGIFWGDALDWFMDVQFNKVNRADVQLAFAEAVPRSVRHDLLRLPGVSQVEVSRGIAVELGAGHRRYRTSLTGLDEGATLQRVIGARLQPAREPGAGVVLTTRLAERLGVRPGDPLHARLLQGERREVALRVGATVDEMAGMNAYLPLDELNALAGDRDLVSLASLRVARAEERAFLARVKEVPAAAVVLVNRTLVETFRETSARNVLFFTTILSAFAATIAVGVVYNNARIQLAERSWELASLRVLGLTRREVSVLLLGELALEIAVAIPLGLFAGFGLAALLIALMPHDVMQIPLVIFPSTYLYAAAIVAAAGVAAALVVRRRIDRLDLVGVLKTRE